MAGTENSNVVIIGAGIAGCATAYYLSKKGVNVTVIDKGGVGDEQSSRAWGFVRQQTRTARELPLMMASNKLWTHLSEELRSDLEWNPGGALTLAYKDEMLVSFDEWIKMASEFGLPSRSLSKAEVDELIPDIKGDWIGGLLTPSDGHGEPKKVTEAFARAAQENGAIFSTLEAVEGIEVANGQVSSVITDKRQILTSTVVCAAGAWSHKVAKMVGISLPYRVVTASVAETTPTEHVTNLAVLSPSLAFRQRPSGTFYVAPGPGGTDYDVNLDAFRDIRLFLPNFKRNREMFKIHVGGELVMDIIRSFPGSPHRKHPFAHTVGVEPKINKKVVDSAVTKFNRMLPSLEPVGIQRYWAGRIDATPDALPVLGEAGQPKGFLFATGFSGRGIGIGPVAGLVTAELIADGKPSIDLHPLRYSRFRDGNIDTHKSIV